jgi:quinol monooxygenase YgiN
MDQTVGWLVDLSVRPGGLDAARALSLEMVSSAAGEPGTLTYLRLFSPDGTTLHAYERYRSSAAAVAHLQTFQQLFADRFLTLVVRHNCWLYGAASDELKTMLLPLRPIYLAPGYGFDTAEAVDNSRL